MRSQDKKHVLDGMYEQMDSNTDRPTQENYQEAASALVIKWSVKDGKSETAAVEVHIFL